MTHVSLQQVGKFYAGNVKAVEDVNIEIQKGEFIVLVGPSGCGKSTTLRMVAGLEDISAGTISINGKVVNDLPPKDRDIAMVFQNYALYPHMTCYDNMAFALKLKGVPKAEIKQKVESVAETLGVSHLLGRKPGQLSGGQRQRIAVGRAMVRRPEVYLFDEPLSNLDARLRVEMRAELKRIHTTLRTTTIYVTHDQEEAMTLGDRVVVMSVGKVQQVAPPLEIFDRPVNRFVAGFLGTPPMNFVEGRLGEGFRFDGAGFHVTLPSDVHAGIENFLGKDVVLGARPEHLGLGDVAAHPDAPRGKVEIIELLGSSMDVFLATSTGHRVVVRTTATNAYKVGQELALLASSERVHLFEPGTHGLNLTVAARQSNR